MELWHEDFETNMEATSQKLFYFIETNKTAGNAYSFDFGENYLEYYNDDEKKLIENMINKFSTRETWSILKRYFE